MSWRRAGVGDSAWKGAAVLAVSAKGPGTTSVQGAEVSVAATYVKVDAPARGEDIAELVMYKTEAEETAGRTRVKNSNPGKTKAASADAAVAVLPQDPHPRDTTQSLSPDLSADRDIIKGAPKAADEPTEVILTNTDGDGADEGSAIPVVVKRALNDVMSDASTPTESGAAEPPPEAPAFRRSLLRPAPSVPPAIIANKNHGLDSLYHRPNGALQWNGKRHAVRTEAWACWFMTKRRVTAQI